MKKAKEFVQFAGEMIKVGKHAFQYGTVRTDKAEKDRRLAICRECTYYNSTKGICELCGCKMVWKAVLVASKCPLPEPKW